MTFRPTVGIVFLKAEGYTSSQTLKPGDSGKDNIMTSYTIETLTTLFTTAAIEAISHIEEMNGDRGLTWGQTDALGDTRHDLREILGTLADYRDDLHLKEALEWVGDRLHWNENTVLDQVCRDSRLFEAA